MAIDKKLIHFKNWNKFISDGVGSEEHVIKPTSGTEEEGTAIYGQIKGTSIVFIKDVGKIWTHGKVYCADQDLSEYITDSELENLLVFGKGEAENSAVLKGEYQGYSNTAISQTSIAIGAATTAGLKGWYYSKIDFNTKQITISDRQPTVLLNNLIGGNWNSGTLNIQVGDVISIINNSKYDKCSKVSNVNGNIITVESLPFTELNLSIISANNPDDWSIYIAERPDAGIIDFGGGSLSEGANTKATNIASHAEGIQTHAYGQYSHAEGFGTKAGYSAHAEGKNTIASGEQSHAEGFSTHATGNNSHAEGKETYATQYSAHAEGYGTVAGDSTSPVIENTSPAEGCYTHAEGNGTRAVGHSSHAEGRGSVAQGKMSHAEGLGTKAIGNASHAEGNKTVANGSSSHAEGIGTVTNNVGEHACGSYNVSNTDTIFSVGIGSSDTNRKNALEVDKNGNVYTYINNTKTSIQDELGHILFNVTSFSDYRHLSDEDVSKLEKLNEVHLKRTYSDQYVTRILKRNNYTYVDDLGSNIHFSCIDDDYSYNLTLDVSGKSISWNQHSLLTTNDLKTINGNSIVGSGNVEISEYDDTEINNKVNGIQTQIDTLVSGDASAAIESFNEITAFLNGVEDTENLNSIIAGIEQQIADKMDDVTLATVATSGSYNDLTDKPTIPSAVTSSTVSDWGFTKNAGTITGITMNGTSKGSSGVVDLGTVLTEHQDISGKQDTIADLDTIRSGAALGATALQSYTEQYKGTVTEIKINGSTHNPSNGVVDLGTISADESLQIHFEPNFDLEIGQRIDVTSLVQQSMGITPAELYEEVATNEKKTALFIHETMGGELQEISRVTDPSYEAVGLSYLSTLDGLPSPFQLIISPTQCQLVIVDMLAGYNSVIAPLTETVEGKQEQLVSGTNIKTINGESILGSGDITVSVDSDEFATKTDLVYAVSKSASQGNLTNPGYYYFKNPTTINFSGVNQYPRGIYSIVIDGFSTESLLAIYPLNFIWTNGEPDFASLAGTTKVLEISLFVLDNNDSPSKKVLAIWALFNF